MRFLGNDPALEKMASDVFAKIPKKAQEIIETTCDQVRIVEDGDCEAEFVPAKREILVFASRIKDFSKQGQQGILAHEFGHAYVSAMSDLPPGDNNETMANVAAQYWGFYPEIKKMKADTRRLQEVDRQTPDS